VLTELRIVTVLYMEHTMTGQVIDLLEARQNMTQPRYAPRELNSTRDDMPLTVRQSLAQDYIGIYEGSKDWIVISRQGHIFNVRIIQTGENDYDYSVISAEPIRAQM